jgi:hypothetical protein
MYHIGVTYLSRLCIHTINIHIIHTININIHYNTLTKYKVINNIYTNWIE